MPGGEIWAGGAFMYQGDTERVFGCGILKVLWPCMLTNA
jgi:hypothetical protein